ncbi:metalloregulator ArsR/SmtB family transcription factor [Luteococcus peritonei]|uniref:ArsR/SmtB family transcription factor n=1 Tax=Luteococcus peritonei TaxID=88874 RepID=A0ABW4RY34_9ACTN
MGTTGPELDHAAQLLHLLGEPTRLALLVLLQDQELGVGELARRLDRPVPAVSQHLARLRTAGLVQVRRRGASSLYSQPDEALARLVAAALQYSEDVLDGRPR